MEIALRYFTLEEPRVVLYRVQRNNEEGIWYNDKGEKVNDKLHEKYTMDFDKAHVGYKSAAGSVFDLVKYLGLIRLTSLLLKGYELKRLKVPQSKVKKHNGYYLIKIEN